MFAGKSEFELARVYRTDHPHAHAIKLLFLTVMHGSYNLEKALNFTSRLEKFLEFGLGP